MIGLLLKGVENRDRKCVFEWVLGKLSGFSSFLGVPLEGLEDEVLDLFSIIEERSLKAVAMDAPLADCRRLRNELKRIDYGINYERLVGSISDGRLRIEKWLNRRLSYGS